VSRMLAGSHGAVVTGRARAEDLRVVDAVDRCPENRVVAILADVTGADMSRALAGRIDTVMAADTIAGNVHMVEVRGDPGVRRMAVVAGVAALDMGRMLPGSHGAVVARAASPDNLCVVDGVRRRPDHVVVAILAEVARVDVGGRLARCFDAVMATRTIVDDAGVIEVGREPRGCRVTVIAVVAAADMRRVFAGRDGAVVT